MKMAVRRGETAERRAVTQLNCKLTIVRRAYVDWMPHGFMADCNLVLRLI